MQSIDWALFFSCDSDPSRMFDPFFTDIHIHIPLIKAIVKERAQTQNQSELKPARDSVVYDGRNSL